ncbi:MFS transporter [Tissierella sp.]|uniref:MFS transporter n=1 Tax=Tissierella sp. TaxID=41274 RepID=UPI00285F8949|nr:MFS transporter [Tissierella sp.]MDR7857273.1 MFS transporter [Tissierella sp.]
MNNLLMFVTTFLIQLIISTEMGIIGPLAPFLSRHFLIKENMVILFHLGYSFVGILVPFLGVFADKYGKKKSIAISLVLFIFGSVTASFAKSPLIFAFSRIFIGFSYFSLSATNLSYVSEFISYKNRGKVSGLLRTAFGIATLLSPIYASFLVNKYSNISIIYLPLALIGVLSLGLLSRMPETKKSDDVKLDKSEFLSLLKNPLIKKMLILVFLILTAPSLMLNYLSIHLSSSFKVSQLNIGVYYTIIAVGTILGIVFAGIFSDRIGKHKLAKSLFAIMLLALIPINFINSLILLLILVTLLSFGLDGGWTAYQALCSEIVPEKRGTFMNLVYTFNAMTITFYSLIGPIIYNLGGFRLIVMIATITTGSAVYFISRLPIKE